MLIAMEKLRMIVVVPLMLMALQLSAQTRTVKGTVSGIDNQRVVGASVAVKGTNKGTVTNELGQFSLDLKGAATLLVSSLGYGTLELAVGATQNEVTVTLTEALGFTVPDVVVTSFGISRAKKALGYSVTQVAGDKFTESRTANLGNALSGKVAGVNVSQPATGAGGSSRVVIRGGSSLLGNDQPLYVINGIPMDNSNFGQAGMWGGNDGGDGLANINPDDVESVSVLKGNTAAALYGARAANGVILITTKTGKARKGIGVQFNSNVTWDNAIDRLDWQKEYGPGRDGGVATNASDALDIGNNQWGRRLDGAQVVQWDGQQRPYSHNGFKMNDFYRTGMSINNSLALSGGNQSGNYRFGVSDLANTDIMPNATFRRQAVNFNINSQLKKLSLSASGQYTKQKAKNRPRLSDSPGNSNFAVMMFPNTIPFDAVKGVGGRGAKADGTELGYQGNVFQTNPNWGAYNFYRLDVTDRFFGNVSLKYDITDWLYIQGRVGTDFQTRDNSSYTGYGTAFKPRGDFFETLQTVREDNYDFFIGADKKFGDFGVDVLVGGNKMRRTIESKGGGGNDLVVPFVHSVTNLAAPVLEYSFAKLGINSIFAQANFSYKNYLFLNLTGRQDQFSTLSPQNNTLFYPSVGASFVASDAFELPKAISFAKLRASWAQVGGGAPDPYSLAVTYGLVGSGHLGANLGQILNGAIPNNSLKPYVSSEFEIGADIRFIKNRFGIDFTYYNRRTTDDILPTSISATSGFGATLVNIGELTNRGVEILVNAAIIQNKNFRWDLSVNFANNINNVVNLGTNAAGIPISKINQDESRVRRERIILEVGKPIGMIAGYNHRTDDKGNKMYTSDGYPVATAGYETLVQGRHPISGGINSVFTFKGFKLDVLIDLRQGGHLVSGTNYFGYQWGLHKGTLPGREGGLQVSGVTTGGTAQTWTIPAANIDNYYQNYSNITRNNVYDASFGRLRQLSLGYTFTSEMLKKTPFESASLSFVARNLALLWSNVPNIDPESSYSNNASAQGLEFFAMPQTRSFGVNLNVNF
jgi:TonB-linked SusC/RagA family outer membrane protein